MKSSAINQAVSNKICADRDRERKHRKHMENVRNVRSSIDTNSPATYNMPHLRENLKREALLEERYADIDKQNRNLLQKMSEIMRQPSKEQNAATRKGPQSLNRDFRKQELIRITQENQRFLKRIQNINPVFDQTEFVKHTRAHEKYFRNACEYEPCLPTHKPIGRRNQSYMDPETERVVQAQSDERERQEARERVEEYKAAAAAQEESLRFVLKEGKKIGDTYYLVEMSTEGRNLTIQAYEGEKLQMLELVVNEKNHRRFYRECNGQYDKLADRLYIANGKLMLAAHEGAAKTNEGPTAESAQKQN